MSLCALNINKEIYHKNFKSESDVYHQKVGYFFPHYVLENEKRKHKRFVLTPKGDKIQMMEEKTKEFELNKIEDSKK